MFSYGITLAKKVGASQLVTCVRSDQQAEVLFLEKRGFQQMGYDRFLKATPNLSHEEPVWPEGFTIRSMAEINDLEVLMKAHNLCYARHWGHYENSTILTVEKVREWMDKNPQGFIHEGIFILFSPTNEIAGVVYGRFAGSGEKRTLIVDSPGVAPEYQHLDLLRPLTLQALQWLRYQGSEPIELHCWGENEETIAVYTKLGFSITPEDIWIEYMRPIP
jgi:ribosomal protein S18 acetylase RimI-like enzyme